MEREDKDDYKKIDGFIQKRMKAENLEQPSMNFTNAVISNIEAYKKHNEVFDYKPLIPKKIWFAVVAMVVALFIYSMYDNAVTEFNWLPQDTLQQLGQINLLGKLPSLSVSNTYVYAFIGLAFFVVLQVYLLKNHFNKRYYLD